MSITKHFLFSTRVFIANYCHRHKHPVNACLHIIGVPMVLTGLVKFFAGKVDLACFLFAGGYFLQYLGHRVQGNEVGEITLLKKLWQSMKNTRSSKVG